MSRSIFLAIVVSATSLFFSSPVQAKKLCKAKVPSIKECNLKEVKELDNFLNFTIDRTHKYYLPKYPIKLETYESNYFALKKFETSHQYFSEEKPLVGAVTNDPEDLSTVNMLLLQVHKNILEPNQRELTTNEILTKIVAYRNLQVGQTIPIPLVGKFKRPKLRMYRVDKVFNLDDGMPAFALVPISGRKTPPILLFRGTNIKNSASVLADLDIKGPGLSIFQNNQKLLREWAIEVATIFSKPRIMGYSLGGSFTQYMCIYESDVINSDPHNYHVMFNQPGVTSELIKKWYDIPEKQRPHLYGFINEGDMVSTVGQLIGDVNELSLDNLLEPIQAHVTFMTAQPTFYSYRLDLTMKFDKNLSYVLELGRNLKKLFNK